MQQFSKPDFDFNNKERLPVAMAYVPWQHFRKICENPEIAYQNGTIFEELDQPFVGRRCVR